MSRQGSGFDPHKYHRRSIRLKDYNYSKAGAYFVTMCVQERQRIFGEVLDGKMSLSRFGEIVAECWNDIPNRLSNVETDAFVVMPDHVHGIIVIDEHNADIVVGAIHKLPRRKNLESLRLEQEEQTLQARMKQRRQMLLPKIIGRFKMNSAKRINEMNGSEGYRVWQRNYYERIIRDEDELNRIREYIISNPAKWRSDEDNYSTMHG